MTAPESIWTLASSVLAVTAVFPGGVACMRTQAAQLPGPATSLDEALLFVLSV
jgi:hypothetical protein